MKIIFLFISFFSAVAFAGSNVPKAAAQHTLTDGNWSGTNSFYMKIIPYAQGVGFGANYEKVVANNFGVGGGITILPEKEDADFPAAGLFTLSGNVYLHMPADVADFYVAPGLNIMMMELGNVDKTTLGASMLMGGVLQFSKSFAAGVEMSVFHPWFNKEFYGVSRLYYFNTGIVARMTF